MRQKRWVERALFRPVEMWVLCLVILVGLAVAVGFAWAVRHHLSGGTRLGSLGVPLVKIASLPSYAKLAADGVINHFFETPPELLALQQRFGADRGFKFNYPAGTRPELQYFLLNRYDAESKKSVSELWDLNLQEKVWTWSFSGVDRLWSRSSLKSMVNFAVDASERRFRNGHAFLDRDAALSAHGFFTPLIRVDACSNLKLIRQDAVYHHSIERGLNGGYWVASLVEPSSVDLGDEGFIEDELSLISSDGKVIFQKSLPDILIENSLETLLYGWGMKSDNDPTHLNDIQPVYEDGRYWKTGDVFLSLRNRSLVLLYRPSTNKILWFRQGPWIHQHDVNVLNDHQISVFSNNAYHKKSGGNAVHGANEVMIFDFNTNQVSSPWSVGSAKLDLRTIAEGRGQVVGDEIWVEETQYGRAIQFDASGKVAWQFINRAPDGQVYVLNWSRIVPRALGDQVRKVVSEVKCD